MAIITCKTEKIFFAYEMREIAEVRRGAGIDNFMCVGKQGSEEKLLSFDLRNVSTSLDSGSRTLRSR